jgi:hypothetical protein
LLQLRLGLGSGRNLEAMTTPRPRAVVLGSLSLFAVLFVVLALELSATTGTSAGTVKASAGQQAAPAEKRTAAPEPEEVEEPVTEEPVTEYVEPEPEVEYVEPEYEEVPPVVTSSS